MKFKSLIQKSEFVKNTTTLVTGTVLAQLIPLILSPILTRYFSPIEYATFGLFLSITAIMVSMASGSYEMAILQPKKHEDAINIASASLILSIIFNVIVFIIVLVFHKPIAIILKDKYIESWLFIVPLSTFLLSVIVVLNNWFNRTSNYKILSINKVSKNWGSSISQILFALVNIKKAGLILGQLVGDLIASVSIVYSFSKNYRYLVKSISIKKMKGLMKYYKNFPLFTFPTVLLNTISSYILIFFISAFFSSDITGNYFLSFRLLSLPMALIGTAMSQTFYQKFTEIIRDKKGDALKFITKIWGSLFLMAIIPSIILFFAGEYLFVFVFGKEWLIAGKICAISAPMVLASFISTPSSNAYIVLNKQRITIYFGIAVFIYRPLAFLIGYYFNDFFLGLKIYVVLEIIQIIIFNAIIYRKIK